MIEAIERLLRQHRRWGLLLDANLLFLFVLGSIDRRLVGTAKRIKGFSLRDFDLLEWTLQRVDRLVVTSYVVTEVSNLATSLPDFRRRQFLEQLRRLIQVCPERAMPLSLVVELAEFEDLGAADAAILRIRTRPPLVLTADWPLAQRLVSVGRQVLNFNHLRGLELGVYTPEP